MNHLLSETLRAAHCVSWCKSLMSLKHPEMLELPGKRFSVLSTLRRDMNDSADVKRHVYLRTIAKLKVHAEIFFSDSVTEVGSNTSTLVSGVGTKKALDPTVWGGGPKV